MDAMLLFGPPQPFPVGAADGALQPFPVGVSSADRWAAPGDPRYFGVGDGEAATPDAANAPPDKTAAEAAADAEAVAKLDRELGAHLDELRDRLFGAGYVNVFRRHGAILREREQGAAHLRTSIIRAEGGEKSVRPYLRRGVRAIWFMEPAAGVASGTMRDAADALTMVIAGTAPAGPVDLFISEAVPSMTALVADTTATVATTDDFNAAELAGAGAELAALVKIVADMQDGLRDELNGARNALALLLKSELLTTIAAAEEKREQVQTEWQARIVRRQARTNGESDESSLGIMERIGGAWRHALYQKEPGVSAGQATGTLLIAGGASFFLSLIAEALPTRKERTRQSIRLFARYSAIFHFIAAGASVFRGVSETGTAVAEKVTGAAQGLAKVLPGGGDEDDKADDLPPDWKRWVTGMERIMMSENEQRKLARGRIADGVPPSD